MSRSKQRGGLAVLAFSLLSTTAFAQNPPPAPHPGPSHGPGQIIMCPASISVRMDPVSSITPWAYGKGPFNVTLDTVNHPRVEGGQMICYYQALKQIGAFVISQPVGARQCVVRPDNKGFGCT